jgi:4-amino-4-deoxy-L-arabinose transferase-like glycosyltransferase
MLHATAPEAPVPRASEPRGPIAPTIVALVVFILALGIRVGILFEDHTEGDELLYTALVQQLEDGNGYTLEGHPILNQPWVSREQYDRPLFHHPPGGIALFWALHHLFGRHGLGLAQLVSFSVFYWSMLALARRVLEQWGTVVSIAVAGLAGFTPIVAHVHTHYWLDGPQVAFATAGAALYLAAVRRGGWSWAIAAGAMLAWACATKMNAVLVLPAVVALGWSVDPQAFAQRLVRPTAVCVGFVTATLAAWAWVQWSSFGEVFPSWAGKPAADLVEMNPFVRFVTTVRGPWAYLRLLPQAMATLVPALLAFPLMWGDRRSRRIAVVLSAWIGAIVLVHVALGYVGYSKLLRYVILVVPAVILLFALAVETALRRLRLPGGRRSWAAAALLLVAALAFTAEVALGAAYIAVHPERALIVLYPDARMMRSMAR